MVQEITPQEQWRMLLEEGKTSKSRERLANIYGMLPTTSRCRICKVPFAGITGQFMGFFGKGPSNLNPHLCNACDAFARSNLGGVEIRLSMLFADIRGSTSLAEGMKPATFRELIDRFYATATTVLCQSDAIIDKLAGDQVSGYFVPGLAGAAHSERAVQAAQALLRATGHADPQGPWIPVGIGVHTGDAFFGSVGSHGGVVDVTALGDAVNIAARLASNARQGEILISQESYAQAKLDLGALERRNLELKGRSKPVPVYVLRG